MPQEERQTQAAWERKGISGGKKKERKGLCNGGRMTQHKEIRKDVIAEKNVNRRGGILLKRGRKMYTKKKKKFHIKKGKILPGKKSSLYQQNIKRQKKNNNR